ncbi:OsmC family protein [Alkalicoccus urumqiensis]|uniref:Osmotically inducible protein C n=1 Tax=Alkalicoccus urumqiensis TaxID=1548213 RepID=A0A2P6MIB3_ALKUR|nr:OsmC family protein [Alkalicoccus urumqiensis]PRO66029.1 osmotically inducible protein C [Alkalicoccus urumqiensis]
MSQSMKFHVTAQTEGMKADIQSKDHKLVIDEPQNMGGTDEGADPLSTLLGALAGCENVVANMAAKEMEFDLQKIEFEVDGELDPRGLMGTADVRPYFNTVSVRAVVHTSESDERIQELKEKTDARCPVFTSLKVAGVDMNAEWTKA